jgi:hypothetical protein
MLDLGYLYRNGSKYYYDQRANKYIEYDWKTQKYINVTDQKISKKLDVRMQSSQDA